MEKQFSAAPFPGVYLTLPQAPLGAAPSPAPVQLQQGPGTASSAACLAPETCTSTFPKLSSSAPTLIFGRSEFKFLFLEPFFNMEKGFLAKSPSQLPENVPDVFISVLCCRSPCHCCSRGCLFAEAATAMAQSCVFALVGYPWKETMEGSVSWSWVSWCLCVKKLLQK